MTTMQKKNWWINIYAHGLTTETNIDIDGGLLIIFITKLMAPPLQLLQNTRQNKEQNWAEIL